MINGSRKSKESMTRARDIAKGSPDLVESALEAIKEALQSRRLSYMSVTDNGLVIDRAFGLPAKVRPGMRVPLGEGVAGWVAETKKPLLMRDLRSDRRFPIRGSGYRTYSFISVPVSVKGRTLGVINVADRVDGRPFDKVDLQMLSLMADHIARYVESQRLRDEDPWSSANPLRMKCPDCGTKMTQVEPLFTADYMRRHYGIEVPCSRWFCPQCGERYFRNELSKRQYWLFDGTPPWPEDYLAKGVFGNVIWITLRNARTGDVALTWLGGDEDEKELVAKIGDKGSRPRAKRGAGVTESMMPYIWEYINYASSKPRSQEELRLKKRELCDRYVKEKYGKKTCTNKEAWERDHRAFNAAVKKFSATPRT